MEDDRKTYQDEEFMHESARDMIANYIFVVWDMLLPTVIGKLENEQFYWEKSNNLAVRVLFFNFSDLKNNLESRLRVLGKVLLPID